ncbi:hypothetical protein [Clostridium saccharoperbutylacetonicum]|uniref:hypothetical protein n=1 Tax=Clostridium saccharoperbutylacetonicum TaxID=36745 RepID=UPI0039E88769
MKKITGLAIVNCEIGKKIAYTYSILDDYGNITTPNVKESFAVVDEEILKAITTIENNISKRLS